MKKIADFLKVSSSEVMEQAIGYGLLNLNTNAALGLEVLGDESYSILSNAFNLVETGLMQNVVRGKAITSPAAAKEVLEKLLRIKYQKLEHEVFGLVWLDNQHRVIETEILFNGTIDSCSVYPREVLKSALRHNAAAVVLFHNHPSGLAEVSAADKMITKKLQECFAVINIRLLDHIIIADQTICFSEQNLL